MYSTSLSFAGLFPDLVMILCAILEIIVFEVTLALGSFNTMLTNPLATFFAVSRFFEFLIIFLDTLSLIFSIFLGSAFFLLETILFSNFLATFSAFSIVIFLGTDTLPFFFWTFFPCFWTAGLFSSLALTLSAIFETTNLFIIINN